MATMADQIRPAVKPITPDTYERGLAIASVVLFACVIAAVFKGQAEWPRVTATIWLHLTTIMVAVALTPVMLLRRRGNRSHRMLGWVWVTAMLATAASSFFVRNVNSGGFSFIHILSVWTLVQVPLIVWTARNRKVAGHRRAVRGMVTGALLVAGLFTFPFDRLLGHWLFG